MEGGRGGFAGGVGSGEGVHGGELLNVAWREGGREGERGIGLE